LKTVKSNAIVAFASGKGGTGKTSLAVNFAKYLSLSQKVVLRDLDVEEPDACIYFPDIKLLNTKTSLIKIPRVDKNKCTLCGICVEKCNFKAITIIGDTVGIFKELCKGCLRCKNVCPQGAIYFEDIRIGDIKEYQDEKLTILEGKLDTGNIHTKDLISDVKKIGLKDSQKTDEIFVDIYDCPPGTTCPMVEAVKDSDFVVLVTEPTPFGLHDLDLAVEVVSELNKKFGVVINKSGDNDPIIESYCSNNNIALLEKIPFSIDIAKKCINGKLLDEENWYKEKMDSLNQKILKYINRGTKND
jgi:MinD superfamily P-loop ATPase